MQTTEADFVAGALATKEAVTGSSVITELAGSWIEVQRCAVVHRQHGYTACHRQSNCAFISCTNDIAL